MFRTRLITRPALTQPKTPRYPIAYHHIQGGGRKFLGHLKCRFGSQISLESFRQSYQANKAKTCNKKVFLSRLCLLVFVYAIEFWSRSNFPVTTCTHFFNADASKTIDRVLNWDSSFTDCNQTHLCCKCWLHSLDMNVFGWPLWYL